MINCNEVGFSYNSFSNRNFGHEVCHSLKLCLYDCTKFKFQTQEIFWVRGY
jgi:DNA-binding XRE family transcriptional regulator